jgi:hypothetical protein
VYLIPTRPELIEKHFTSVEAFEMELIKNKKAYDLFSSWQASKTNEKHEPEGKPYGF